MLRCECRLSVRLSVTKVHWRLIANLGSKFRFQFTAHCGRGACGRARGKGSLSGRVEGSSRAMLTSARPSSNNFMSFCKWGLYTCSIVWRYSNLKEGYTVGRKNVCMLTTKRWAALQSTRQWTELCTNWAVHCAFCKLGRLPIQKFFPPRRTSKRAHL